MKVYPKNSFDRFGDDLTELILQYMTFEDKVRLECVSKQWRRLVFNKQFVIELNAEIYYEERRNLKNNLLELTYKRRKLTKRLKSVLMKYPNIKSVKFNIEVESEVLSLIGRYCPNIKSLTYNNRFIGIDEEVLSFFRINGHKLEELNFCERDEVAINYLRFCPNLKYCHNFNNDFLDKNIIVFKEKEFLPNLEKFDSLIDMNKIIILSDKYSQTLNTSLQTSFFDLTEELKTCIECIARFENLKELELDFINFEGIQPIDDCLSLIGQKCNKLLKLDLSIFSSDPITDRFFDALSEFEVIKK